MAQVTAKKSSTNGFVLGVEFKDGRAETDSPAALAFFDASPIYTVGSPKAADKPADSEPKK